jgi:basic amino acid/polyamine antiporter, APA family
MIAVPGLRRVLTFWPLVLYGLGVIVGAGIYVALGEVVARAGATAPFSFVLAGGVAALTGLCYAELAGRFPDAAGAAAYVEIGFQSRRFGVITGLAVTLTVAIATASIARGSVIYLRELAPLPDAALMIGIVGAFTALAISGVRIAVGFASLIAAVEIGGLVAVVIAGILVAPEYHFANMLPTTLAQARGVVAGSFIAFFAFVGFETLANMAEEVEDPSRIVPRGIVAAIAASVVLYMAVAIATVLSDAQGRNPLLALFSGKVASAFAFAAFFAVANGVLVQIVMLARLFYGMARRRQLPGFLATVSPRTQTPVLASLVAGTIVLLVALTAPFERLLAISNTLILLVFALVDLSLWRIHRRSAKSEAFTAPAWAPPTAVLVSILMVAAEILN